MENYQMRLFQYEEDKNHFQNVRTVKIGEKEWFVASDVAKVLWYEDTSDAIRRHCDPDGTVKRRMVLEKRRQNYLLIDEPNVYRLVAKSKLSWAKKFEKWIYEEVLPQIREKGYYGKIDRSVFPNFIQRMFDNQYKIPYTHFAVLTDMFITLYREFERCGYTIPDKWIDGKQMMPDISVGKTFAKYLKDNHPERANHQATYRHKFPDGKIVDALMYPVEVIPIFRKFIFNVWLPEYADQYFAKRDPLATNYIPIILWLEDSKNPPPRLSVAKQTVKKTA